jgi:hypothetical protein
MKSDHPTTTPRAEPNGVAANPEHPKPFVLLFEEPMDQYPATGSGHPTSSEDTIVGTAGRVDDYD